MLDLKPIERQCAPPALFDLDGRTKDARRMIASIRDWVTYAGGSPDKGQRELIRSMVAVEHCAERQLSRAQNRDNISDHFTKTHLAWRNSHRLLVVALDESLGRITPHNRPTGILKQLEGTAA